MFYLVGYLHRCTKTMHGHTNIIFTSVSSFKEDLSGFFPRDLPVVKISPEWVTGQQQGKSSGRIATLASGPAWLGMAFPPFLVKQLYRCDSVVISSFVRIGYATRRWGWLLGRIGYNITHHYSRRITAAEMKYMRITAGYTWTDYRTNTQIANELKITPILDKFTGIQEQLGTTCK